MNNSQRNKVSLISAGWVGDKPFITLRFIPISSVHISVIADKHINLWGFPYPKPSRISSVHISVIADKHINLWGFPYPKPCGVPQISSVHISVIADEHINLKGFPYPKPSRVLQISSVHISVIADKHINLWVFPYPKLCVVLQICSGHISVIADKHINLWGFRYPKPSRGLKISSVHISVIADKHINLWVFPYPKLCVALQICSVHISVIADKHINLWGFRYPKPSRGLQICSVHISVIADKHINLWVFPYPKPSRGLKISSVHISVIADKHINLLVFLIINRLGYFMRLYDNLESLNDYVSYRGHHSHPEICVDDSVKWSVTTPLSSSSTASGWMRQSRRRLSGNDTSPGSFNATVTVFPTTGKGGWGGGGGGFNRAQTWELSHQAPQAGATQVGNETDKARADHCVAATLDKGRPGKQNKNRVWAEPGEDSEQSRTAQGVTFREEVECVHQTLHTGLESGAGDLRSEGQERYIVCQARNIPYLEGQPEGVRREYDKIW
ncbi:hypothetical protein RRG08_050553 [Elysia crispata]|uniref:Uncharacterized protein n=1 Tax=Elysia crispata TaxID=231223 RepID=A0AAE1DBJ9_9GAST|nr:hypothetical protein RRG08_050553 [Elysia crispata]